MYFSQGARMAQLHGKNFGYYILRIASLTAGWVFFWYGPLASLSFQIASMASKHHGKKMEVIPTSG